MIQSGFNVTRLTHFLKSCAILAIFVAFASQRPTVGAQSDDQFEGAVWRFTMKPKFASESESKGGFRVMNNELFQKESPKDEEFSKKIGTNHEWSGRLIDEHGRHWDFKCSRVAE